MKSLSYILIHHLCWISCLTPLKKTCWILITLLVLLSLISFCSWLTCSPSSSISNQITSIQFNFTGYESIRSFGIISGPKSNSLYYSDNLYNSTLSSVTNAAIMKINSDESLAWMTVVSFSPIQKSLTIDINEQYIYLGSFTSPLDVTQFSAITGTIVGTQKL